MMIRSSFLMSALLMVAACSNAPAPSPAVAPADITNPPAETLQPPVAASVPAGIWNWVGTLRSNGSVIVKEPSRYTIEFQDDGYAQLLVDCNRGRASYSFEDTGAISIGSVGLTKMGCPADSQSQDFLVQLGRVQSLEADPDWMRLSLGEGNGTAVYARDPQAGLRTYVCASGEQFALARTQDSAWLWFEGELQPLARTTYADGERYAAESFNFSRQGDSATLTVGARTLSECRVQD